MRRLFFGYSLSDQERADLATLAKRVASSGGLRVIPEEKWHITLLFLGDVSDEQTESLVNDLKPLQMSPPGPLKLDHFGAFPEDTQARIFWIGTSQPHEGLQNAHAKLREFLGDRFPLDDRPFHPHLTITRLKPPKNLRGGLVKYNADMAANGSAVTLALNELHLMESVTVEGRHEYRSLWKA